MTASLDDLLAPYDFRFPKRQIAVKPATPRDSARMVVLRRATHERAWTRVSALPHELPTGALLVRNCTRVIPAQLALRRSTGGLAQALVVQMAGRTASLLVNRRLQVGEELVTEAADRLVVLGAEGKSWRLESVERSLVDVLQRAGATPLPPYMRHSPLTEAQRRQKYQSIFARHDGSVAAPTASLHFTPRLLASLEAAGVTFADVTLHVNLGTFAPLTDEHVQTGRLHTERYEVPAVTVEAIRQAKAEGRPVIPIGTTALRALESAARATGELQAGSGETSLFIQPGFAFRVADGLLTNFHVPKSSLLMLVAALTGRDWLMETYEQAIRRDFRLFSFGDAMLVL
jgi:S-adenosylmethionine:tRNA ribosyltransferase-isomerase